MTTPNTSSVSNSVFFRKKGRKCRNAEIAEIAEDAPAEGPAPVPAPAPTLENSWKMTTYSKNKEVNKELWEASQHT